MEHEGGERQLVNVTWKRVPDLPLPVWPWASHLTCLVPASSPVGSPKAVYRVSSGIGPGCGLGYGCGYRQHYGSSSLDQAKGRPRQWAPAHRPSPPQPLPGSRGPGCLVLCHRPGSSISLGTALGSLHAARPVTATDVWPLPLRRSW